MHIFNTLLIETDSDLRNDILQTDDSITTNIILIRRILLTWRYYESNIDVIGYYILLSMILPIELERDFLRAQA